jgi:hypothetical protein
VDTEDDVATRGCDGVGVARGNCGVAATAAAVIAGDLVLDSM